jgi:(p)ppGpp synthase/HD superfamily hydrolase
LAERVTQLAAEWRLPIEWVAGACHAAGIPCDFSAGAAADSVAGLADELRAWERDYLSFSPGSPTPPPGPPALRLRELYRAIYCDSDDMRHILMLLAAQHLRLFDPAAGRVLADEMLSVFVPVAEMLGMYHVRRAWVEQSMRIREEYEYAELAQKMKIVLDEPTSEHIEYAVNRQQTACLMPDADAKLPPVKEPPLPLDEGWRLFTRLRENLEAALHLEWGDAPLPRVDLVPDLPGRSLRRGGEGGTTDPPQFIVRLICRTRGDCYRALGVVHDVCPPVGSGQGLALRDYIGSPRTNGYRTLQTLCLWTHPIASGFVSRVVNFRILTDEMHELNEWGILAERAPRPTTDGHPETWWKRLDKSSKSLAKRSDESTGDIAAYLRRHLPGTTAHPIYCFTPVGEILWLDKGSTALDFAFRIHSQLIQHTARIFVNGEIVAFGAPLTNGDLVEVEYDLNRSLADFCWQDQVKSKRARGRIRAALRRRALSIHPGYNEFEMSLIRQMDHYTTGGGDTPYRLPTCSTSEIELFLRRAALKHNAGDREALYDQLAINPGLVERLAHQFITEQVISDLRLPGGRVLQPYPGNIRVCAHCKPASVHTDIEGRLFRGHTLIIHRRDCRYVSSKSPVIELEWAPQEPPDTWPLYHFEINTRDSDGLLNNVLRLVYDIPHTYLFSIKAVVNERGRAIIDMDVAVRLPQLRRDLKRQFAELAEDTQVNYRSLQHNRRGEVSAADMSRQLGIPFTKSEVTDWRFFGRDETINSILSWINGHPLRSQLLLLHGQRRVGKSSLIGRLVAQDLIEYPNRKVVPVRVNFLNASLEQPHTVAELLVQRIFSEIGVEIPSLGLHEDPIVWLDRQLLNAERRLRSMRLLIIVDEFDAGYDRFVARNRQPSFLQKLQTVISTHPEIRWLLVVQSVYLADPLLQAALPDLPVDVPQIAVRHLPRPVARQLIVDLSTHHGLQFAPDPARKEDLPDQIVDLTAGNPFFIHILGRGLLLRVDRERRNQIAPRDLERTISELLGRPGLFDHLFQSLPAEQQTIVRFIAEAIPLGRRLPLDAIRDTLATRMGLRPDSVATQIALLEQIGVLEMAGDPASQTVGIPIQLLHKWLCPHWVR